MPKSNIERAVVAGSAVAALAAFVIALIFVVAVILGLSAKSAHAGAQEWSLHTNICGPVEDVLELLSDEAGENEYGVLAQHDLGQTTDFLISCNPRTGTWTLMAWDTEDTLCVIGSGQNFSLFVERGVKL